ncbi:MAG: hypothetical protein AB7P22_04485, partial [Vicinamibacterales bacterium]
MTGSLARFMSGLALAALVWAAGSVFERQRFGADDQVAVERIEAELAERFAAGADVLTGLADPIANDRGLVAAASREPAAARRLFETLSAILPEGRDRAAGITVYGPTGEPVAWAGRVSDLPEERISGPQALFVAPGALGPRLVRVEPVHDPDRAEAHLGSVVVEQLLGEVRVSPAFSDTFALSTSLAPVRLRARLGDPAPASPYTFVIPASDGQLLVEARVDPADLQSARQRWRAVTLGAALMIVAAGLLFAAVPLVIGRRAARQASTYVSATAALVSVVAVAYAIVRFAAPLLLAPPASTLPLTTIASALALTAVTWLLLGLVERRRLSRPPILTSRGGMAAAMTLIALAGASGAVWLWGYQRLLAGLGGETVTALLRLTFLPLDRFATSCGLVLLHAAVIWSAALMLRAALVAFRFPRGWRPVTALSWAVGAAVALALASRFGPVPLPPLLFALATIGGCAAALSWPRARARRASQAARLGAFFLALVVPVLAMYPTLRALANESREQLIADQFAPQAADLRDDLQERLRGALEAIDALPSLEAFIAPPAEGGAPTTDQAFSLWRQTDLATYRLTSAVELYTAAGQLTSRFALNLPGYSAETIHIAATCDWELIEEVSPFGSSERHVLRASRAICTGGRRLGSVIVRAMLDYRTLPFIQSESPYLASLGPRPAADEAVYRDFEFVVYGWSRAPIQTSGTSVWTLPDSVFD